MQSRNDTTHETCFCNCYRISFRSCNKFTSTSLAVHNIDISLGSIPPDHVRYCLSHHASYIIYLVHRFLIPQWKMLQSHLTVTSRFYLHQHQSRREDFSWGMSNGSKLHCILPMLCLQKVSYKPVIKVQSICICESTSCNTGSVSIQAELPYEITHSNHHIRV